jgi:hypothetical protein
MIGNTIALYANHNKIQQSRVEFFCLINFIIIKRILTKKKGLQNKESTSKEKEKKSWTEYNLNFF